MHPGRGTDYLLALYRRLPKCKSSTKTRLGLGGGGPGVCGGDGGGSFRDIMRCNGVRKVRMG